MGESVTYVRIVGEPFLSRALEYRGRREAWYRAWWEFAKSKGASGFGSTGNDLSFVGREAPRGWTKPKGDSRFSHPKSGHQDVADFARMQREHKPPACRDVFGEDICYSVSWRSADGSEGSHGIADLDNLSLVFEGAWVGWAGAVFIAKIPDAEAERQRYARSYPDRAFTGPAATWVMPSGLVRISEAEKDLIIAEHRVASERARAAAE